MPRVVFCEELEGKLIELWAAEQKASNGTMKKRSVKEKVIAVKLNLFGRELYGDKFQNEITVPIVHNKLDNLRTKAREQYKKYRRHTATGSGAPERRLRRCRHRLLAELGARPGTQKSRFTLAVLASVDASALART